MQRRKPTERAGRRRRYESDPRGPGPAPIGPAWRPRAPEPHPHARRAPQSAGMGGHVRRTGDAPRRTGVSPAQDAALRVSESLARRAAWVLPVPSPHEPPWRPQLAPPLARRGAVPHLVVTKAAAPPRAPTAARAPSHSPKRLSCAPHWSASPPSLLIR
eukprot:scaffold7214_cov410-Prasinococcus_capsulatus_cf.AAC.10